MSSTNKLAPIPHPPKKPVVGNMLSLDANAPVQDLARLAKELGPIFWLDMMGSPIVIVGGHDLVDELSDEKRFDKAVRGSLRRVRAVGGDGLFTADTKEPNWTKAHNILLQPFGNRAMQSYHPSMVDIAEQLVKKWERLNTDEEIDVVHDMTALTLDTIGLCGFDYRFNSFYRSDYHPFVESLVRSLETIMMTRGLPLESLWMQKRRRDLAGDVAFMNSMVDEIIAERRKNAEATEAKKDMLGAMMTGVDRATGEQLDDVNIRYQINTFLIAGHETTSGLLSCAIYAMLKHPEVLKKAYEEVDRVFGPDVNAKPTYQQVTQLHYITQILKESLRLWPPAPAYGIAPVQDETIGGGKYKLRKGTFVTILVLALHRDPSVWGGRSRTANQCVETVRQRPARLYRPWFRHARSCAGARHDPAALQDDRPQTLPDGAQGNADHQARRFQDQSAPAPRSRAQRLCRTDGCCHLCCYAAHARRHGSRAAQPQHAAAGALWLQSRHSRGTGDARCRSRRGQRLRHQTRAARRVRRQAADRGWRADLLRVLQWRGTGQCHAIRQLARHRPAEGRLRQGALRGVRLRQQRLAGDLSIDPPHYRRSAPRPWRDQRLCAR
jgi:cytochrome P450